MYRRSSQGWLKHIDFILWDVFALQAAFILAYMARHGWGNWPYAMDSYRSLAIILAVVDVLISIAFNTMHNVMKRGPLKEFTVSLQQAATVLVLMSLYLFTTQVGDVYSRVTLYLTAGGHLILGYGVRMLWKTVMRRFIRTRARGSIILVADEGAVEGILKRAGETKGFQYSGIVLSDRDGTGETLHGIPVVSDAGHAAEYICREWVDEIFIYRENEDTDARKRVNELIDQCREMAIPIHICLPYAEAGGKSFVENVGGYSALTMTANWASPRQALVKRLFDILGGIVGSIAALVILAFVGPKIKKASPGPVLFRQTRIGQNGKRFTCYKIRSMYMDAEERKKELMDRNRVAGGMMFKVDFDPRIIGNRIVDGKQVTGIGEKIRRLSLDEFPQFFNILKGDMSLVGTRPPTEDEWEKYKYHHRARLAVKPGLTGMWQVSGRSRITDFEEVVKLDTEYITNWSIGLDLRILLKTVKAVLTRDGAM